MGRYAHEIDPHMRANALVCRRGFRSAFAETLGIEVHHELIWFEHEADAKAWLLERCTRAPSGVMAA
jgi:hypothetical protein